MEWEVYCQWMSLEIYMDRLDSVAQLVNDLQLLWLEYQCFIYFQYLFDDQNMENILDINV